MNPLMAARAYSSIQGGAMPSAPTPAASGAGDALTRPVTRGSPSVASLISTPKSRIWPSPLISATTEGLS